MLRNDKAIVSGMSRNFTLSDFDRDTILFVDLWFTPGL